MWFATFLLWPLVRRGEAAHVHPHGLVVGFDVGRRDVRFIGLPSTRRLRMPGALCRAVAPALVDGGAVQLHNLPVVDIGTERALNRL